MWPTLRVRANPLLRAWMSLRLRDLPTTRTTVRLALWRGGLAWWLRPRERREARRWAGEMLGAEAPAADVRALARAGLAERRVSRDIGLRMRDAREARIDGLEHLDEALAAGRGVILLTAHCGPKLSHTVPFSRRGYRCASVWHMRKQLRGRSGLTYVRRMQASEQSGSRALFRGTALEGVRELLRRGEICNMLADVSGTMEAQMLGRRVWLAGGWARLARETGAVVVPMFQHREGDRVVERVHEPVYPADADSPQDLHARAFAALDRDIAAHLPQYYPRVPPARPRQ